jgi:hypothetical protein
MFATRSQPRGPRCGNCGYNLTGAPSNRCPECGLLFIEAGVVVSRGRAAPHVRRVLLVLALLLLPVLVMLSLSLYLRAQAEAARAAAAARMAQARAAEAQAVAAFQQSMLQEVDVNKLATQPADRTIKR